MEAIWQLPIRNSLFHISAACGAVDGSHSRVVWSGLVKLAMLILGLAQPALATDYFIDAIRGDDTLPGTQAAVKNSDGPWRTLARIQDAVVRPGDRILLRCDGVWPEPLLLRLKGTAASPIVIGAYGGCAGRRPEIRPTDAVLPPEAFKSTGTGWAAALAQPPGMVGMQEAVLPKARFPATGTLPLIQTDGKLHLQLRGLPVSPEALGGADWVVRTNDYTIEERRLYNVDAKGAVQIAKPFAMPPPVGAGYYLEGQPWMLTGSRGWAYDPQAGRLVLRERPSQPVTVYSKPAAIVISQSEHVRLQRLAVRFAVEVGVDVTDSQDIVLDNLDVRDVGEAFVRARQATDFVVTGLQGHRSQRDGIVIQQSPAAQVVNSVLEDVGVSANPRKSIAAVLVDDSPASWVARNRILRSGYAAIMFGKGARVEHNIIEDACMQLADCGAIYTSGANKHHGIYNAQVKDNLIIGVPGNLDGSTSLSALTAGIYLDDETRGIVVSRNFVEKAQRGIFSKAAASHITDNTLFDNAIGIMLTETGVRGEGKDATEVSDNTLVSRPQQKPYLVTARANDTPLVNMQTNLIRSERSAATEVWLAGRKLGSPTPSNARQVGKVFSLANTSAKSRVFACPLPATECKKLRQPNGTAVKWPLELAPGKAVLLMKVSGA